MCVLSQKYADESSVRFEDVLSTVAYTSITDTEASESCFATHTCNVHGLVPDRILSRKKALYYM
jgi:hypothetical protein